jgi:hypothetical protein
MFDAAGWVQDQDVDQTADFVVAQPERVRRSVILDGVRSADREDGESGQARVVKRCQACHWRT